MRTKAIFDLCGLVGETYGPPICPLLRFLGPFRTRILGDEGQLDGLLPGSVGQKDPGAFQVGQPQQQRQPVRVLG